MRITPPPAGTLLCAAAPAVWSAIVVSTPACTTPVCCRWRGCSCSALWHSPGDRAVASMPTSATKGAARNIAWQRSSVKLSDMGTGYWVPLLAGGASPSLATVPCAMAQSFSWPSFTANTSQRQTDWLRAT